LAGNLVSDKPVGLPEGFRFGRITRSGTGETQIMSISGKVNMPVYEIEKHLVPEKV
jgi:hypothetical protein